MRVCYMFMVTLALTVFVQAPLFAGQIFFSNLVQPGNQYGPDGLGIGHTPSYRPGDTGEVLLATGFTPSTSFRLTSLNIGLGYAAGFSPNGPNRADVFLTDDLGGLPGNTIEFWLLTNLPAPCGPCPLIAITSVSNPTLIAGKQYWVVADGGAQTFDFWTFTSSSQSFSPVAFRSTSNGVDSGWRLSSPSNSRQGALQVSGDSVPEPTTPSLTALVLSALLLWRSRSTKQRLH